jgi:hypothetical protein
MRESDFEKYGINHFTGEEIEETGADLKDINVDLIIALDLFRSILGYPVYLLENGMTTGSHSSWTHPAGMAVDGRTKGKLGVDRIIKAALQAGFKGIGVYWNGQCTSFHLDIRPNYAFWAGHKKEPGVGDWTFTSLFNEISLIKQD